MATEVDAGAEAERNPFRMRGELTNAGKLERWMARNSIDVETAELWTTAQWVSVARAAGINSAKKGKVPNERTRGIAIGMLIGRYRRQSHRS